MFVYKRKREGKERKREVCGWECYVGEVETECGGICARASVGGRGRNRKTDQRMLPAKTKRIARVELQFKGFMPPKKEKKKKKSPNLAYL